jgi:NAD(P)H-dependent flavin oxidoreductase YrpB (nitropropane dioxygenase family)
MAKMMIKYTLNDIKEKIEDDFTYHAPKGDDQERYEALRSKGRELAHMINDLCPSGFGVGTIEKIEAIKKLQECVMWANASIARHNG